jgi:hypothetical protein
MVFFNYFMLEYTVSVKLYGIIDLDHFATTSAVFCIKITKHVGKKDMVKV